MRWTLARVLWALWVLPRGHVRIGWLALLLVGRIPGGRCRYDVIVVPQALGEDGMVQLLLRGYSYHVLWLRLAFR